MGVPLSIGIRVARNEDDLSAFVAYPERHLIWHFAPDEVA